MNAGKYILIAVLLLVAFGIVKNISGSSGKERSNAEVISQDYSSNWSAASGPEMQAITKTLLKKNIPGCGEYYFKRKNQTNNQFAVACTSDGKTFKYYLVWAGIDEVKAIGDDGITHP